MGYHDHEVIVLSKRNNHKLLNMLGKVTRFKLLIPVLRQYRVCHIIEKKL